MLEQCAGAAPYVLRGFQLPQPCTHSRLCEGLLPLGRRDGEIEGNRRPCKGGQIHISWAASLAVARVFGASGEK